MADTLPKANWYPDPHGRFDLRYWDGAMWTEHVSRAGVQMVDDPSVASPTIATNVVEVASEEPPTAASNPPKDAPHKAAIPVFGARKMAASLQDENARLQRLIDEHGLRDVAELDAARTALQVDVAERQQAVRQAEAELARVQQERSLVEQDLISMRATVGIQEFGIYDYEHPAETSVKLAGDLEALRLQIKQAVSSGQATTASSNFTFNNSAAKGKKFVNDMSKLMLRSYNAEAENCVKTVRAGNLDSARSRLSKAVEQVERLGTMISLQITPYYHRLRIAELELAARHLQAVQAEKEADRAHREELREQKRAEQELQAEKARLEKERAHYANALATLEAKGDLEGAERMRQQIEDTEKAIANVDYRVANARAGYVYVISNVGSFGPDVVKIGMTRRLEPMDRVNELGDASVPFRFDVHALFFSSDAVALEAALHQHFAQRRINRINLRREYFRATPAEVLEALREHHVEVLEYTIEPAAEEYRASMEVAPA